MEKGQKTKNIWKDHENYIEIISPLEFNFKECLVYLDRSKLECLHKVTNSEVYKALKFDEISVIVKISAIKNVIKVEFLNGVSSRVLRERTARYIYDMFDLSTDLTNFYEIAKEDEILSILIKRYYGLRIIKMEDLFEAISWAIMGQQINLNFAYTLKKRLVESYGEKITYEGEDYFIFPTPDRISMLSIEELRELQFTSRKAEYIIGIAKLFSEKKLSKEELSLEKNYDNLLKKLVAIRGIGNWTADYVIMKCFNFNTAFPIADVGIHNALKNILNLGEKPKIDYIEKLAEKWKGWEAYATFYLWRSLYD